MNRRTAEERETTHQVQKYCSGASGKQRLMTVEIRGKNEFEGLSKRN